ncbi:MAG: F0F1 ATP synthase subunit B [Bacteroidota bacterium]
MLDINPGLILWTIVTFVLLLIVLKKFAWTTILNALNQREEHIRQALKTAEDAKLEAERILQENRRQLDKAEEEARRILNEGRALGEKLKAEIVEKASQQSRKMVDQAKQEIDRERDAALSQLRTEVATLALMAAGKILNETLDAEKHRKLVDDVLKTLPHN